MFHNLKYGVFVIFFLLSMAISAQNSRYIAQDKALFEKYIAKVSSCKDVSEEKILEMTAKFFLETPYVANTLEGEGEELLTVNLREMDCFTYVENVIALSQMALSEDKSFETYLNFLRNLRYRNGEIIDYTSRLHYTCDWAFENTRRGLLCNISESLGGICEKKNIDFMSNHRDAYRQLKSDDAMLTKIIAVEKEINSRGGFYYLPKTEIAAKAKDIPHMAVIAFTTSIDGLDVTHVGFVWKKNGKTGFIHTSSSAKKVVVDTKSLSDYCLSRKSCTGIMVMPVLLK